MQVIKTWIVHQWLPNDAEWFVQQGIRYHISSKRIPIHSAGGSLHYAQGPTELRVQTNTEHQETVLRLKFEPGLTLMQIATVPAEWA